MSFFVTLKLEKLQKDKLHPPFETTASIISQPDKSAYKVA